MRMKKPFRFYFIWLSVLTAFLGLLELILFKTVLSEYFIPVFWLLLLFFYVIHAISQSIIIFSEIKRRFNLSNVYLISFVIKFFSYLVFLIIYLAIKESITITFALVFFSLYLVYTFFDVRMKILLSKTYLKNIEKSD